MKEYLKTIIDKSKLLQGFSSIEVTSLSSMEEIVNASRATKSFVALDTTIDGEISKQAGYNDSRFITIYVLKQFGSRSKNREQVIQECRKAMNSLIKRMIRDQEFLICEKQLILSPRFPYWEIPEHLFDNLTGVYFNVNFTEPKNLIYEPSEFTD